ncbi:hypothetical protein FKM82_017784 [Ascaphus truei]
MEKEISGFIQVKTAKLRGMFQPGQDRAQPIRDDPACTLPRPSPPLICCHTLPPSRCRVFPPITPFPSRPPLSFHCVLPPLTRFYPLPLHSPSCQRVPPPSLPALLHAFLPLLPLIHLRVTRSPPSSSPASRDATHPSNFTCVVTPVDSLPPQKPECSRVLPSFAVSRVLVPLHSPCSSRGLLPPSHYNLALRVLPPHSCIHRCLAPLCHACTPLCPSSFTCVKRFSPTHLQLACHAFRHARPPFNLRVSRPPTPIHLRVTRPVPPFTCVSRVPSPTCHCVSRSSSPTHLRVTRSLPPHSPACHAFSPPFTCVSRVSPLSPYLPGSHHCFSVCPSTRARVPPITCRVSVLPPPHFTLRVTRSLPPHTAVTSPFTACQRVPPPITWLSRRSSPPFYCWPRSRPPHSPACHSSSRPHSTLRVTAFSPQSPRFPPSTRVHAFPPIHLRVTRSPPFTCVSRVPSPPHSLLCRRRAPLACPLLRPPL